jgi:hypothetical protein
MTAKKTLPHPAEKLLFLLDVEPAESYGTEEIENLSLNQIKERLHEFGMEAAPPVVVAGLVAGGSQTDEQESCILSDVDHIETLPHTAVVAKLDALGIDYRSGLDRIKLLVETDGAIERQSEHGEKKSVGARYSRSIVLGNIIGLIALAGSMGLLYTSISDLRALTINGDHKILETLEKKLEAQAQILNYETQRSSTLQGVWEMRMPQVPEMFLQSTNFKLPDRFSKDGFTSSFPSRRHQAASPANHVRREARDDESRIHQASLLQ